MHSEVGQERSYAWVKIIQLLVIFFLWRNQAGTIRVDSHGDLSSKKHRFESWAAHILTK